MMKNDQLSPQGGRNARNDQPKPVGDNRRAGDTDGNAAGGNSRSEGVIEPEDQPEANKKER